jgi:LemA protein|tara:strand:- start:1065 stop:1643 length:579 start_codon:yes stop_codon:yes gene_type:complete
MKKIRLLFIVLIGALSMQSCGYNTMVEQEEVVAQKWADVQTQYQRRADLIPNLVNTVKGFATQEKEVLTQVVEARAKATSMNINAGDLTPEKLQQFQSAQGGLRSALGRLMVVVEKYPELKSNQNFLELQAQLEGTENRISVARQKFNAATKEFNSSIRKFPSVLFASSFGFEKKPYFEAEESAKSAPTIEF